MATSETAAINRAASSRNSLSSTTANSSPGLVFSHAGSTGPTNNESTSCAPTTWARAQRA